MGYGFTGVSGTCKRKIIGKIIKNSFDIKGKCCIMCEGKHYIVGVLGNGSVC